MVFFNATSYDKNGYISLCITQNPSIREKNKKIKKKSQDHGS
jgi:hypothetical protein